MTMKRSHIFKTFDVVVVPIPFLDDPTEFKNRPALILSSEKFNYQAEHSIATMITSASNSEWPLDITIKDLKSCGLLKPSTIRFKFFTLDHRLIKAKIGSLSLLDKKRVQKNLLLFFKEALWLEEA